MTQSHLRWDHRDDPQTARLHDDDLVANDEEMVAAPCGINLHDPRREQNVFHGPRHHGAHREREVDAGAAVALLSISGAICAIFTLSTPV